MGLTFLTEEQRNPTKQPLSHEQLQAQKVDPCETIQAELDLINQFLEDNGYAHLYDHYKYILANPELATGAEVISDDNVDFEEIQ